MKKTRAILSVLLALLMLCSCFAPVSAVGAEGRRGVIKAPRMFSGYAVPDTLDQDLPWAEAIEALDTLYFTDATEVDVSEYAIPATEENLEYLGKRAVLTPKLLNRVVQIHYNTVNVDDVEIFASFDYSDTAASAKNAADRAACEDVIYQLMYGVKDNANLNCFDKLLILHDRLAAWVAYDQENLEADTAPEDDYGAYNPLINHTGVCQGYAMVYGWMLDELGIENYYESSSTLEHGWNKVKIEDAWYYVDVTNDDPIYDVPGRVLHNNFLVPFSVFQANHDNASDYDQTVTGTAYVDSFDKKSSTEIVRIGTNYYYLRENITVEDGAVTVNGPAEIILRSAGGTEVSIWTLSTATSTTTTYEDDTTTVATYAYAPKMTAVGNLLYFIDGKTLYSIDVTESPAHPREVFTLHYDNEILKEFASKPGDTSEVRAQKATIRDEFLLQGLQLRDGNLYVTAFNNAQFAVDTVEKYTVEIPICTHSDATLLREAPSTSCLEAGSATYFCATCRALWTEETPAAPHSYTVVIDTVAPTCSEFGKVTKKCSECGDEIVEIGTELDPDNHPEDQLVNVSATIGNCVTEATSEGVFCNACGKYKVAPVKGEKNLTNHVHTEVTLRAKTATCFEAGYTAEIKCKDCGETVQESVPVPKREHEWEDTDVPPTCTQDGYTLHKCKICFTKEKINPVPALNHPEEQREVVPGVEATCVSPGYTEGVRCNACNTFISGHTLLFKNPNNHPHGFVTMDKDATCEEDGFIGATLCPDCGAYKRDENTLEMRGTIIPAKGHQWDEGTVLQEATCTDSGIVKKTCTVCGKTSALSIDKLDHLDLDNDQICDRCSKNLNPDACPFCNKIHTGTFAFLTKFIHKILYLIFGPRQDTL